MTDEETIQSKFICTWLDNKLIKSEEYADAQDQLQTLAPLYRTFRDSDQCIDFITDVTEGKIIFITSNLLGKNIVPLIHTYEQIHAIYIFHSNKSADNVLWTNDYKKIKEVFYDISLIPNQFVKDTTEKENNDPIAISFLSSVDINSKDINRQDPSFMYFQLIKEILLCDHQSESDEETKIEMITFCRKIYIDDPNAIVILDEFEQSFIPELSIYWYTRECFLYKMLNKALWTPQSDVLYKLRYFLRHLYYQILSLAETQRNQLSSSMIVYRGQSMSREQIQKLKQNVGGFLSFNNFLSTSLEKDIARNFVIGSEDIEVLFEMQIDSTIEKFPLINIELISYLKKEACEQEILFAMGSVFRIIQIQQREKNFYCVQLKLSGDVDQQLVEYTKRTRKNTQTSHSFLSLLRLMNELSQYSSVDKFAEMLQEDVSLNANPAILGAVHHMFGSIYHARGQTKKALDHFQKSLNIYLGSLPADHPSLTPTYNNIGSVYLSQMDYNKAFEFQKLALDCQMKSDNPDSSAIVIYTNNLAKIYSYQGKHKEALEYHKRALEVQKQSLGENDPSLTETYDLMSAACVKLFDIEQAG